MNKEKKIKIGGVVIYLTVIIVFTNIWLMLKSHFQESMENDILDIFFIFFTAPYIETLSKYLSFLFLKRIPVKIHKNKKSEYKIKRFDLFVRKSACYLSIIWIIQNLLFKESFGQAEVIMCFVTVGINWFTSRYSALIEMEPVLLSDEYYITGKEPKEIIIGKNIRNDISKKAKMQFGKFIPGKAYYVVKEKEEYSAILYESDHVNPPTISMNINFCTFDLGELRKASNSETFDVINDVADGKITDAYEIAKELHDHHIPYKLLFFAEHGLLRNEIEEVYEEKFLPIYKKCLKEGIAEFIGAESKE